MPEKGKSEKGGRDEHSKNKGGDSSNKKDKNQENDSNKKASDSSADGRKKQKEYFKEELRRLQTNLDKEASKIVEPERKEFTPDIFNTLEPYYNTDAPHYLIELPDQVRHGYVSRQTAIGLCDPWINLRMDIELLPKIESKIPGEEHTKKKSKGTPRSKEGSTHLPKFPHVCVTTDDITKNKKIYYDEVPALRQELRKKYSYEAEDRINAEYKRTKQDFYRMELDKMEEYHPSAKPKMKATYFAYLQNNLGSRKAVHECVKETEDKEKRDKEENDKKREKKVGKDDQRNNKDKNVDKPSSARSAKSATKSERSQDTK